MRRRVAGLAALGAAAAAGCGGESPDLFEVVRTGKDPNANVRMVVSDGGSVTCNGRDPVALNSERLLEARGLARALDTQAALDIELAPGPRSQLRYRVRMESGSVAFSDTSRGRPRSFDRLVAFVADVVENVCRIER